MKLSRITIVVTQASQPFLYSILNRETNDRARAALLKRLAEDGARGQSIGVGTDAKAASTDRLGYDSSKPMDSDLSAWFK
jgi:hypothetical protein